MARHGLAIGVLARCDSPVQLKGMPLMGQHTLMKESYFIYECGSKQPTFQSSALD